MSAGGYFVSEEQQDAVIGRVARERSEAKKKLALLRAEAVRIGQTLADIGRRLQIDPQYVVFEREPVNIIYSNSKLNNPPLRKADINGDEILKLTNDIRATTDNLKILEEQAKNLGISD